MDSQESSHLQKLIREREFVRLARNKICDSSKVADQEKRDELDDLLKQLEYVINSYN